jgi:hypothetical protein
MEIRKETRKESETSKLTTFFIFWNGLRGLIFREMERLQYRNQKFEQRNDQLVNALLNFASELSPNKRRELEVLVMVSIFAKFCRVRNDISAVSWLRNRRRR